MRNNTIKEFGGITKTIGIGIVTMPISVVVGAGIGAKAGAKAVVEVTSEDLKNRIQRLKDGKVTRVKKGQFEGKNIIIGNFATVES